MEFAQRSNSSPAGAPGPNRSTGSHTKLKSNKTWSKVMRWGSMFLLVSIGLLIAALVVSIGLSKTHEQSKYVNSNQYQAVFLNGGQVYFGKIGVLNKQYMTLGSIYYLRVNQTVQPNANTSNANDVSLVKLGCELHGPQDQMVINADQVVFWENLKSDGQVAKAVAEFQKQNPKGQNCAAAAANNSSSTPTTASTTKP
ncbi:MAG: hypothetical protein WCJ24_02685 [Candidatus Saccharibacteria bacterium]